MISPLQSCKLCELDGEGREFDPPPSHFFFIISSAIFLAFGFWLHYTLEGIA